MILAFFKSLRARKGILSLQSLTLFAVNLCPAEETGNLRDNPDSQIPAQHKISLPNLNNPEIVLETKQIFLPEFPDAFNPSIIALDEEQGFILVFRYSPDRFGQHWISYVGAVYLDKNFDPVSKPQLLSIRHAKSKTPSQSEDPRIFSFRGRYFIIFNDCLEIENPSTAQRRDMYLTELYCSQDGFSLSSPIKLFHEQKYNEQWWQKNWVPFLSHEAFFLIYSIDPHNIIYPNLARGNCWSVYETESELNWKWGHLRGGTPALLVDGEYLSFFHSSIKTESDVSQNFELWHYFMGAYTFSPEPPFQITKITPSPLAGEGFYTSSNYEKRVIFPGGYAVVNSRIYVTYGKDDQEMWVATLNKAALMKFLKPIAQN
jgi:predicted GH43/DUF377 family glycosyl hydrolase